MPQPEDALFSIFADSFKEVDWEKAGDKISGNMTATISNGCVEELEHLKAALAKKHLRVGKYIKNGHAAFIFELETDKGEPVESAIIRLEPLDFSNAAQSAITRRPVMQIVDNDSSNPYYRLSIVPRAIRPELPNPVFEIKDMLRTFEVLNGEGLSAKLADINMGQIMLMKRPNGDFVRYSDNTPVAVITDPSCMRGCSEAMGNMEIFLRDHHIQGDAIPGKASQDEIDHVRAQMDEIYARTEAEVNAAIARASVPTQINDAHGEEVGNPRDWGLVSTRP